jgi:hypothetical protein
MLDARTRAAASLCSKSSTPQPPLSWAGLLSAVEYSPFYGIEKGAVLQEARIFHDPNLDPRRCSQVG